MQTGVVIEEVQGGTKLFYWMDRIFSDLKDQPESDSSTCRKLMGSDNPCYEFNWDYNYSETKVWKMVGTQRLNNFSKYVYYTRRIPGKKAFYCTVTVDCSSGSSQFDWIPGKKPTGISVVNGRKNLRDIDADF
jgi:hypothetical protein